MALYAEHYNKTKEIERLEKAIKSLEAQPYNPDRCKDPKKVIRTWTKKITTLQNRIVEIELEIKKVNEWNEYCSNF